MVKIKLDVSLRQTQLALVLLDLVGSTAFVQKVGAVRAAKWLQYHDQLARSLIYKNSGREIDRSDGFLMSFESVADAVTFAVQYNRKVSPTTGLRARIGIHWGQIVEVYQDELYIGVGAKKVELEGISKNIAARTMSLANPSQILLTKEAFERFVKRPKRGTPSDLRYACVGMYRFKGVKDPQQIYAVSSNVEALQPPKGTDKAKRLGGPKYIRKRIRDRKLKDWVYSIYRLLAPFAILVYVLLLTLISQSYEVQSLLGLEWLSIFYPLSKSLVDSVLELLLSGH